VTGVLSAYATTAVLDGNVMPKTYYAKAHLGSPGPAGSANFAGESRRMTLTFGAAVANEMMNSTAFRLNEAAATEDWTHLSLWDSVTAGNVWWIVPLSPPLAVEVFQAVYLDIGTITLGLDVVI